MTTATKSSTLTTYGKKVVGALLVVAAFVGIGLAMISTANEQGDQYDLDAGDGGAWHTSSSSTKHSSIWGD